jgi:hypothetical protein
VSTPEGLIKERVKRLLRKHGVYWHCPVQNGMGSPSLDFICCVNGRYLGIETKAPGKKMTPRQENTAHEIRAAGGTVFVIDGELGALETWIILTGGGYAEVKQEGT